MRSLNRTFVDKEIVLCIGANRLCGMAPSSLMARSSTSNRGHFTGSRILLSVAVCLLLLCVAQPLWALPLGFQGIASTLSTGSIVLSQPNGVAVDTAGNIYIADTGNNRIVKVTPQGNASVLSVSVSGVGLSQPQGIAVDASGTLYIADSGHSRVVKVSPSGSASVVGTGAVVLSNPSGVAVDPSGNIFIADTYNNRIVEAPSGGVAVALAITVSSGLANLTQPVGLAVDTSGNLYIVDSGRIVFVANAAGGGTAGSVLSISGLLLIQPSGVAVDSSGNIFITDSPSKRIVIVDTNGNGSLLSTGSLTLNWPQGIALDTSGNVYIADRNDNQIVTVTTSSVGFGHLPSGTNTGTTLTLPFTIGGDPLGSLGGNTLPGGIAASAFTVGTASLDFTVGSGTTCTVGMSSQSCTVDIQFLPTAPGLRRGSVVLYNSDNQPEFVVPLYGIGDAPVAALSPGTASVISTGAQTINFPTQIAFDGAGNMYVGDYSDNDVVAIPAGGGAPSVLSTGSVALGSVAGVAIDGAGNLFISDSSNSQIVVVPGPVPPQPGIVNAFVLNITGLTPPLNAIGPLAFDALGNLEITYQGNNRIVEVTSWTAAGGLLSGIGTVINTPSYPSVTLGALLWAWRWIRLEPSTLRMDITTKWSR